jgi:hypothetical protein
MAVQIAVLDDWQNVARDVVDWSVLDAIGQVSFLHDFPADNATIAERLQAFQVICVMQARHAGVDLGADHGRHAQSARRSQRSVSRPVATRPEQRLARQDPGHSWPRQPRAGGRVGTDQGVAKTAIRRRGTGCIRTGTFAAPSSLSEPSTTCWQHRM